MPDDQAQSTESQGNQQQQQQQPECDPKQDADVRIIERDNKPWITKDSK